MRDSIKAVLFDLGGVVLGSPLHAIARFEATEGIPEGFVNRHVMASAPDGAWHRLERGELALGEDFFLAFDRECRAKGQTFSSQAMMAEVAKESEPRPQMLRAIGRLRDAGFVVGALTNNWSSQQESGRIEDKAGGRGALRAHFDHFLESSVLGLRKPDPEIYRRACQELGVDYQGVVFLDDIGANLKSARALGMTTIKVVEPEAALRKLEAIVGLALLG